MKTERPVSFRDHLVGLAMVVVYVAILLVTSRDLGMTRDEGFYVDAAESYAGWFRQLFEGSPSAFDQSTIDAAWSNNHEHPSLVKGLFALSWLAQERWQPPRWPAASRATHAPARIGLQDRAFLWFRFVGRSYRANAIGCAPAKRVQDEPPGLCAGRWSPANGRLMEVVARGGELAEPGREVGQAACQDMHHEALFLHASHDFEQPRA